MLPFPDHADAYTDDVTELTYVAPLHWYLVVLGHHAHVPQKHLTYKGGFAALGLGNFIFDSHVCRDPKSGALTGASMRASSGCRRMHPRRRELAANMTRESRLYRIDVAPGKGVVGASFSR